MPVEDAAYVEHWRCAARGLFECKPNGRNRDCRGGLRWPPSQNDSNEASRLAVGQISISLTTPEGRWRRSAVYAGPPRNFLLVSTRQHRQDWGWIQAQSKGLGCRRRQSVPPRAVCGQGPKAADVCRR